MTVETIRETVGRVSSSRPSAAGSGTWGVVIRTIGPSRSSKHSSAASEAISAPQPQRRGFSSTVNSRLV
jgi:hypothetical protein